ncbi:MAG: SCP2 sterol-binding domain-containing protein [Candidatus Accumulibacter sp.]|nr:SCP2 sterol-binding domain-containing protein [Accumulibacter sp.]
MNGNFTLPKFKLPNFVASLGRKLPQWPHALALVAGLNAALKMKLLPESELGTLEDKLFLVRVLDSGGEACFTFRNGLFRPVFRPEREPDLAFAANLSAYLQLLARQEDPDTLFFNRELAITGDTELGLFVKNMLDAVEWPPLSARWPSFRH